MKKIVLSFTIIITVGCLICFSISSNEKLYSTKIDRKTNIIKTSLLNYVNDSTYGMQNDKDSNPIEENNYEKEKDTKQNEQNIVEEASTVVEQNKKVEIENNKQLDAVYVGLSFNGSMTAFGKDCCGTDEKRQGITSTGFDLKQSLTYNDKTYGKVRILASDGNFPYYSIIKINDPIDGIYNAVVLDRAGSVIGLNKQKKFDLAVESQNFAINSYGVHSNVKFEVLRIGK